MIEQQTENIVSDDGNVIEHEVRPIGWKISCQLSGDGVTDYVREKADEVVELANNQLGQLIADMYYPED